MAVSKKATRKTSRKNKVNKQLAQNVDLMLDGAVYIVEYDDQGKIISKAELDGEAVLKALLYVLTKASKARPKKP